MTRSEVLRLLTAHQRELEQLGVVSLSLFGSIARDEGRPDSDIDLLTEVRRPMGAFGFLDIKQSLERLLGRRVDLFTAQGLRPPVRAQVLREAVQAFGPNRAA